MKNERKAQTAFYNRYLSTLNNTALRYAASKQDAKDILQKSFVKIFKSLDQLQKPEDHLINWMKRITINTAINHKRTSDNYNKHVDLSTFYLVQEKCHSNKIEDEQLVYALNKLKPIYYEIVSLIAIDGYSHKEASALLGIDLSSSRGRYSRAIKAIRSNISNPTDKIIHG